MPPIGAHIQIKGGLAKGGLAYTDAVGARAVQVFVGNPRGWKLTAGDPAQDAAVHRGLRRARRPVVHPHAVPGQRRLPHRGHRRAVDRLDRAQPAPAAPSSAARGVVVHAGSAVGEDRYEAALRQLHERLLPVLDAAARPTARGC